ncbi:MAG: hypothetical protein KGH64_05775, partial [Candidatus Micrarchaeota archaeon]|nr:hypothetical protein [Candidatus Micrarchaeota archaeon]
KPSEVRAEESSKTHHEIGAVINVMSRAAGKEGKYVHFAMTSADAVETAKAIQYAKATDMLIKSASETRDACLQAALKWKSTIAISRTHGQHAIPASFGLPFAFFGYCLQKNIDRLKYDREKCIEGKLSGVIGVYDVHRNESIDGIKLESTVLKNLSVRPSEISMQIPPRENTSYLISDIASLCGRLETIAAYMKNLKRSEILELIEEPDSASIGSSAMPHKNQHGNPFIEERCISIARIVRGYAVSSMESVFNEDFRDLTASLSDRIAVPESFILADYSCGLVKNLIERATPVPESIERNLNISKGTTASQLIMSRLVSKGMHRSKAREVSFRNAKEALSNNMHYTKSLLNDKEVMALLSENEIKELTNPSSNIGMSKEIIEKIAKKYANS